MFNYVEVNPLFFFQEKVTRRKRKLDSAPGLYPIKKRDVGDWTLELDITDPEQWHEQPAGKQSVHFAELPQPVTKTRPSDVPVNVSYTCNIHPCGFMYIMLPYVLIYAVFISLFYRCQTYQLPRALDCPMPTQPKIPLVITSQTST